MYKSRRCGSLNTSWDLDLYIYLPTRLCCDDLNPAAYQLSIWASGILTPRVPRQRVKTHVHAVSRVGRSPMAVCPCGGDPEGQGR